MKNIILTFVAVLTFSVIFAQSSSPRFGTAKGKDNTGRTLTYKKVVVIDATGCDTTALYPNAFETFGYCFVNDSISYKAVVGTSFFGDRITLLFTAKTGASRKVKFVGSYITNDVITITADKKAVVGLIFDGSVWKQEYKSVE